MKIISRGTLPGHTLHTSRCSYCQTVVEFREDEAKFHSDQRDGSYFEVKCPVCTKPITANYKLPSSRFPI